MAPTPASTVSTARRGAVPASESHAPVRVQMVRGVIFERQDLLPPDDDEPDRSYEVPHYFAKQLLRKGEAILAPVVAAADIVDDHGAAASAEPPAASEPRDDARGAPVIEHGDPAVTTATPTVTTADPTTTPSGEPGRRRGRQPGEPAS